jgi:hypothetical protein
VSERLLTRVAWQFCGVFEIANIVGVMTATNWVSWHDAYSDPKSELSKRRASIVAFASSALDAAPAGDIRVLSLCCGDSSDLVLAAKNHKRADDLVGVVVEFDAALAAAATNALAAVCPRVEVRCANAADPQNFWDVVPVDLLLLCGIFGNISDQDIAQTIAAVPSFTRTNATVIWTRHRREPDVTTAIRQWFNNAGCKMLGFESPGEGKYSVGCERVVGLNSHPDGTRSEAELGPGNGLAGVLFTFLR